MWVSCEESCEDYNFLCRAHKLYIAKEVYLYWVN